MFGEIVNVQKFCRPCVPKCLQNHFRGFKKSSCVPNYYQKSFSRKFINIQKTLKPSNHQKREKNSVHTLRKDQGFESPKTCLVLVPSKKTDALERFLSARH